MITVSVSEPLSLLIRGPQKLDAYTETTTWTYRLASVMNCCRDTDASTLLQVVKRFSDFGWVLEDCIIKCLQIEGMGTFSRHRGVVTHEPPRSTFKEMVWTHFKKWLAVSELCIAFANFVESTNALKIGYGASSLHTSILDEAERQKGSVLVEEYLVWLQKFKDATHRKYAELAFTPDYLLSPLTPKTPSVAKRHVADEQPSVAEKRPCSAPTIDVDDESLSIPQSVDPPE